MTREEAINVVKNNWPDSSYTRLQEALETLIPELKESEDEKVRKHIIEILRKLAPCHFDGNERSECIAWLEKQGEQKPTAEEVLIKAGLKPYKDGNQWCILVGDNIQEGICGFGDTIEDALYDFLKEICETKQKQGEQHTPDHCKGCNNVKACITCENGNQWAHFEEPANPAHSYCIADKDGVRTYEDKPVEWSDEDEKMLEYAIDMVTFCYNNQFVVKAQISDKVRNWLFRLKTAISHQTKTMWNEEDNSNIDKLIEILPKCIFRHPHILERDECRDLIDWLKSLRPQKHWKPSEEQIAILRDVAYGAKDPVAYGATMCVIIQGLEQLKAL